MGIIDPLESLGLRTNENYSMNINLFHFVLEYLDIFESFLVPNKFALLHLKGFRCRRDLLDFASCDWNSSCIWKYLDLDFRRNKLEFVCNIWQRLPIIRPFTPSLFVFPRSQQASLLRLCAPALVIIIFTDHYHQHSITMAIIIQNMTVASLVLCCNQKTKQNMTGETL